MAKSYIQSYSGFIGADMSSDPRAVARNRLAYSVNMWRDYESEQGEAIETFPGFRIAVNALSGKLHGLYHYRTRSGVDYVIAHFGTKLYAFEKKKLAAGECTADNGDLEGVTLADADSTGFVYNNNLYILDGSNYWLVTTQGIDSNETVVAKNALKDAYIPTTYYNGKPYEQRNMLTNTVWQYDAEAKYESNLSIDSSEYLEYEMTDDGWYVVTGIKPGYNGNAVYIGRVNATARKIKVKMNLMNYTRETKEIYIWGYDSVDLSEAICKTENESTFPMTFDLFFSRGDGTVNMTGSELDVVYIHRYWDVNIEVSGGKSKTFTYVYEYRSLAPEFHYIDLYDPVSSVNGIKIDSKSDPYWFSFRENVEINGATLSFVKRIYFFTFIGLRNDSDEEITLEDVWKTRGITSTLLLHPNHFTTIKSGASFFDGNPDYKKTSVEALQGCTKAAVYDGRVFLTGNPDLPNTTFYTHRNLTGANDPAYFGVYNYFNDGVGNTPNVELLALPSMLMVLKNDTLSDGSIYYHVGQFNTDEDTMGLLPRIYPATTGAAGLGSVGENDPGERRGNTTCNFLDDPVFLSRRGLEAVGKEQVNLERAVTHRSSNVDRLLIKEDLSEASIAEWKGYLVICVNGNMYLADSRHMSQHPDGSVQYEWYYLEGLKTYERYAEAYKYLESPGVFTDEEWAKLKDEYHLKQYGEDDDRGEIFWGNKVKRIGGVLDSGELYFREVDGVKYILERAGDEMVGNGEAYPAKKIIAAGQHLIFGTDRGDLCIINTDKRGESVGERKVKADVIDYTWYTFARVRYVSGCSTKLDDCDQKIYTKTTIPGTTTVRFKTMLNSSCKINSRVDGENWSEVGSAVNYLGRATGSELDFGDINFANFAFTGNDNNVVVVPEISRCWINKQYYVYSDGYAAPFGLYELSYAYKSGGRIRY